MPKETPILFTGEMVKRLLIVLPILFLSACTTPCPKPEPYICPPDLGTTWGETDAQGCTRYVCSVGGRGGFVEAP